MPAQRRLPAAPRCHSADTLQSITTTAHSYCSAPPRAPAATPCRLGTATADVPAKVGDRVTVVCSPQQRLLSQRRLLSAAPSGTTPGGCIRLGAAGWHARWLDAGSVCWHVAAPACRLSQCIACRGLAGAVLHHCTVPEPRCAFSLPSCAIPSRPGPVSEQPHHPGGDTAAAATQPRHQRRGRHPRLGAASGSCAGGGRCGQQPARPRAALDTGGRSGGNSGHRQVAAGGGGGGGSPDWGLYCGLQLLMPLLMVICA